MTTFSIWDKIAFFSQEDLISFEFFFFFLYSYSISFPPVTNCQLRFSFFHLTIQVHPFFKWPGPLKLHYNTSDTSIENSFKGNCTMGACVLTQPVNPKGLTGLHTAPEMAVSHSVYLLIPEIHSLIKKVLEERVKVTLKVPR